MAHVYINRVACAVGTTGIGTVTFGSPVASNFIAPASASPAPSDGDTVTYILLDGNNIEIGRGTLGGSLTTMTRDTVEVSLIAGTVGTSKLSLSGAAVVRFMVSAADYGNFLTKTGDASQLTGAVDQVARDMAGSALAYAMASNDAASILGPVGAFRLSDDFETNTLNVVTGGAYVAASDWYANDTIRYTETSTTDSGTSGYGSFTLTLDRAWAVNNEEIITDLGVRAAVAGDYTLQIVQRTSAGNYTVVASVVLTHTGGGGFEYARLASPYTVPASGDYHVAVHRVGSLGTNSRSTAGNRAVSTVASAAAVGGTYAGLTEDSNIVVPVAARRVGGNNVNFRPVATTISADPDDVLGYFAILPINFATIGTNVLIDFSIDGGTTWAAAAVETLGALGATGEIMFRALADVSGQTGTSLLYRLTSTTDANFNYTRCVGVVPLY
ncbi:hypothetical protein ACTZWW_04050 [Salinarimonas sp. NSM]|uniref:hypothetical protein n=1 Tax=Salinarimonas sp. NSM TaxID=3458003 RepID=UPI0040364BD1